MKKRLPFIIVSISIFVVIMIVALTFGVKLSPSSTDSFKEYDLNQVFFLFKRLNEYSYASFYYRAMIFIYWYLMSAVLTSISLKIYRKVKNGKKSKS